MPIPVPALRAGPRTHDPPQTVVDLAGLVLRLTAFNIRADDHNLPTGSHQRQQAPKQTGRILNCQMFENVTHVDVSDAVPRPGQRATQIDNLIDGMRGLIVNVAPRVRGRQFPAPEV